MKKFLILLSVISAFSMTTSCKSKVECDFCSELKYCEERVLFDDEEVKMYICEDCLNELEEAFAGE